MSYPEDRVLIGVINRVKDLRIAQELRWYRIPQSQFPGGLDVEYLGLFLSRQFGAENGAVRFYAQVRGVELVYRSWLFPAETQHPRSDDRYYKISIGSLIPKLPPIMNTRKRRFAFVQTTWEQFITARTLQELSGAESNYRGTIASENPSVITRLDRTLPDDQLYV